MSSPVLPPGLLFALDGEVSRAQALQEALNEAKEGKFISHQAMLAWANSLATDHELPPPKPDIQIDSMK